MDGVSWFKSSEQAKCIHILFNIHSVAKLSRVDAPRRLLKQQPLIVGLFHGKTNPNVQDFTRTTVEELERLEYDNFLYDSQPFKF